MSKAKRQLNWTDFLKIYSEQNEGRLTRVGVFENQTDIFHDYWLGSGLPFTGIDVDTHGEVPTVEVMFDGFTHTVRSARSLDIRFSLDGESDGIDISDSEGKTTLLRFENNGIGD